MTMTHFAVCAIYEIWGRPSRSSGKERDAESGLDYFGARYYASNIGRWMSPDWNSKPQDVPYANLADPQSLNLYSYVLNNPMATTDPNGHLSCKDDPGLCAAITDAVAHGRSMADGWADHANSLVQDVKNGVKGAEKALDKFNTYLGFGKTNCSGGGSCSDAVGQAAGAVIAGVASDGVSEEDQVAVLSSGWSKGTFAALEDSLAYHFAEHGEEVAAKDMLQYLRKADSFASNLQRSKIIQQEEGAVKFIKNGRYVIKNIEGKIVSFGKVRQ